MQWVTSIALLLAGALISLVVSALLADRVTDLLAGFIRLIGSPPRRRGRSFTGQWFTYWVLVPESGSSSTAPQPSDEVAVIQLRHVGERMIGSDSLKGGEYTVNGTLDGQFITGLWHDYSNGRYQVGGFQLFLSKDGMIGKFIGRDSKNHINHGIWLWARTEESLLKLVDYAFEEGYSVDVRTYKERIQQALRISKTV